MTATTPDLSFALEQLGFGEVHDLQPCIKFLGTIIAERTNTKEKQSALLFAKDELGFNVEMLWELAAVHNAEARFNTLVNRVGSKENQTDVIFARDKLNISCSELSAQVCHPSYQDNFNILLRIVKLKRANETLPLAPNVIRAAIREPQLAEVVIADLEGSEGKNRPGPDKGGRVIGDSTTN